MKEVANPKPGSRKERFKQNRRRLFYGSKPNITTPSYEELFKWVAASLHLEGREISDKAAFAQWLSEAIGGFDSYLMLHDRNGGLDRPVGLVGLLQDELVIVPHVHWFAWANGKNKLRASAHFFLQFRHNESGIMRVHCAEDSVSLFRRLNRYCPLHYVARIPKGDRLGRGDDYIFYIKGLK